MDAIPIFLMPVVFLLILWLGRHQQSKEQRGYPVYQDELRVEAFDWPPKGKTRIGLPSDERRAA